MLRFAIFCMSFGALVLILESFFGVKKLESQMMKQSQIPQEKPCFYVQANALNVRQTPNIQAQILQTLPKNTKVCEYFGVENGFLRLSSGYVSAEYLSLKRMEKLKVTNISIPKKESKILLTSTQKIPQKDNLQLARLAISNQDYTKAKTLALKINQENPKNIESWEIFTKALYLEGNKNEAMLILQKILAQSPNKTLMELLEQMRKGERI